MAERTSVLYVADLPDDRIDDEAQFSIAGRNKKSGYVELFRQLDYDLKILSPVSTTERGRRYVGGFESRYQDVPVRYTPLLVLHPILNILFAILASVLTLRHFRGGDVDVVVFYNFEPQYSLPALVAKYWFGASLVVEYEDGLFKHPSPLISVPARIMRWLVPIDGAFLVAGTLDEYVDTDNVATVRGLASVYDLPDDVETAPLESFVPELDGAPGDDVVDIVFSGGLREGKGVDLFLDAIDALDGHKGECRFIMTGHGKPERKAEIEARAAEITDHEVVFLGTVDPWERYLRVIYSADVLVVLEDPQIGYNNYCFPSKLIEYAMTGNVIVTADIADVGEIDPQPFVIIDGYTPAGVGRTFEAVIDDIERESERAETATAEWLERACSDAELAKRIDDVISAAI
jgi:glycosyltransferase involved in cell wall biosynthesis